jgi:glycosyltransferase involved in cell wall biosynthesis
MFPHSGHPYSGVFVAREAEALERGGVEVQVETVALTRGEADYFTARSRIHRRVRDWNPDVCHAHYGYTLVAAAGCRRPLVATFYGDDVNGESNGRGGITLKSRVGRLVTSTLGRSADRILVQSRAMRDRLSAGLHGRTEILASGIDDQRFTPGDRAQARRRLQVPVDSAVIGFVHSGKQPTKRLDLAQAAMAELQRRGTAAHLLVAESVPADDMPSYYQACDCLLMTSDTEGSPNCVKEALACGTPVVSVPVGDVPEIVTRPEQGRIVERTPAALAEGIEAMLQSPRARHSLLPERLHASQVTARLIEIYGELQGTPMRPE